MLRERVEGKWIDCFAEVFGRCGAQAGDAVAILSETQSRPVNVELAALALHKPGCKSFHLVVPSPRLAAPAPLAIRSGTMATTMAAVVIRIGRSLTAAASSMAARRLNPLSAWSLLAKSTIRMPCLEIRPIRVTMPICV